MIESKIKYKSSFNSVFKTSRHKLKNLRRKTNLCQKQNQGLRRETDRQTAGLIAAGGNRTKWGKPTPNSSCYTDRMEEL